MSRIIGIDYGIKRCGVAVTDILEISINPLKVIPPEELLTFLKHYISTEEVSTMVIGWPTHKDGEPTYLVKEITAFIRDFQKSFPLIQVVKIDESFSSLEARSMIFESGVSKKKRREKALVDQVSAVIIIKRYLEKK